MRGWCVCVSVDQLLRTHLSECFHLFIYSCFTLKSNNVGKKKIKLSDSGLGLGGGASVFFNNFDRQNAHARGERYLQAAVRLQRPDGRVSQLDVDQRPGGGGGVGLSTGESVTVLLPQRNHRFSLRFAIKAAFHPSARGASRCGRSHAHEWVGVCVCVI